MAKGSVNGTSPAVNWFFNDWQGGTMILTRHQKGCYMDLLTAQFNHGHLSEDSIKTVLGSDFGTAWPALQKKFKKDAQDLYYNERLESEILKRTAYSESQSKKRSGKSPDNPGGNGNGNGSELENRKRDFENEVDKYVGEFSEKLLDDFKSYWLETSKNGKKYRFEKEPFFDFKKRMQTFLNNDTNGKYSTTTKEESVFEQLKKEGYNANS